MRENDFYISVPSDLDLWPLELKFAPVVTLVQRYVFTKLEVSMSFMFWENWRNGTDGQTDGVQHLMQTPRKGRVIKCMGIFL